MSAPFIKWAGGKGKLAPVISSGAPARLGTYHEPFVGAGAVFFALNEERQGIRAVLNDVNEELMATFEVVRDDLGSLIDALSGMAEEYLAQDQEGRKGYYYQVRAEEPGDPVSRAARFIFLNRTGYNGLYRVNRSGRFNVPHGRYANPRILQEERLVAASQALQQTELTSLDFAEACERARPGDFVYFDPPYQPLSATSKFTSYTSDDFSSEEQERLRDVFEAVTRRGVAAVLSNSSHPLIRELYEGCGYTIATVQMSRAINSKAKGRAPIDELLIDNFERVGAHKWGMGVADQLEGQA